MKDLVKIDLYRLGRHKLYWAGCLLALGFTAWFLLVRPIPQLEKYEAEKVAILLNAGISFYFSFFVGLFLGSEWADGILRNKVMAGHSQKAVLGGHYLSLLAALGGMTLSWLLGALAGGVALSGSLLFFCLKSLMFNAAFIAVLQAICFRLRKQSQGIIFTGTIFYMTFVGTLAGNLLYSISMGRPVLHKIVALLYNTSAIGQCFAGSGLADEGLNNPLLQIPVSLLLMAGALLLGSLGLNKRSID